jgi:hypothetical protein
MLRTASTQIAFCNGHANVGEPSRFPPDSFEDGRLRPLLANAGLKKVLIVSMRFSPI